MPSLAAVRLNGASRLSGEVQATEIGLEGNGASRYELSGSGTSLTIEGDGASTFELGSLAVEKAGVTLDGSSRATRQ